MTFQWAADVVPACQGLHAFSELGPLRATSVALPVMFGVATLIALTLTPLKGPLLRRLIRGGGSLVVLLVLGWTLFEVQIRCHDAFLAADEAQAQRDDVKAILGRQVEDAQLTQEERRQMEARLLEYYEGLSYEGQQHARLLLALLDAHRGALDDRLLDLGTSLTWHFDQAASAAPALDTEALAAAGDAVVAKHASRLAQAEQAHRAALDQVRREHEHTIRQVGVARQDALDRALRTLGKLDGLIADMQQLLAKAELEKVNGQFARHGQRDDAIMEFVRCKEATTFPASLFEDCTDKLTPLQPGESSPSVQAALQ